MNAALRLLPELVWLVPALPLLALVVVGLRVLSGRARGDGACLLYISPSPRDGLLSRMPSSA